MMNINLAPDDAQLSAESSYVIGIDLGTTFSCVAVYKNGISQIIPNSQYGDHLTPSIVFYDPETTDVSIGKYADQWGIAEKTNLIYDIKRLMGRKFDDIYVQNLLENGDYNYKIVRGEDDNVEIEVKQNNRLVTKTPEEISSEILKYFKDSASKFLGFEVTEAVVSVPAHFSNAQRKATKRAAELAGLTVLKLICEPVAAAIYYSMDKLKSKSMLLVFDFGGGTLDVSVIEVDNEKFEVKGIEGDSFLGGRDFDKKLFDFFFHDAKNKIFKKGDKRVDEHLLRVKKRCIKIKIQLSVKKEVSVNLDHFGRDEDESIPLTISQEKFEELCKDLFTRATDLITQCLDDLGLTKNDINEVLLVGGTTRIPKVKELLQSYFSEEKLKTDLNPDEAVGLGAAIQAAILQNSCKELEKYKVTDVTPLTLGFELDGGLMEAAIKKNTVLPAKSNIIRTTTCINNQERTRKKVYEGERKNCKFNVLLATLLIKDLPPGRVGDVHFETIFTLNEDGILEVESWEISKGNKSKIAITTYDHRLSQRKIKSTLEESQKHKEEDNIFEQLIIYRTKIRTYCYSILYEINKISNRGEQIKLEQYCNELLTYTDNVDNKKINDLRTQFEAFEQKVNPIILCRILVKLLEIKLK